MRHHNSEGNLATDLTLRATRRERKTGLRDLHLHPSPTSTCKKTNLVPLFFFFFLSPPRVRCLGFLYLIYLSPAKALSSLYLLDTPTCHHVVSRISSIGPGTFSFSVGVVAFVLVLCHDDRLWCLWHMRKNVFGQWAFVAVCEDVHHVMIIIATSQQARIGVLRGGTLLRDKHHIAQMAQIDHTHP
jgi:hypothetical protein